MILHSTIFDTFIDFSTLLVMLPFSNKGIIPLLHSTTGLIQRCTFFNVQLGIRPGEFSIAILEHDNLRKNQQYNSGLTTKKVQTFHPRIRQHMKLL